MGKFPELSAPMWQDVYLKLSSEIHLQSFASHSASPKHHRHTVLCLTQDRRTYQYSCKTSWKQNERTRDSMGTVM